jgi:hypothetical protein
VHARTTQIQADPAMIEAGITYVRDEVIPAVTGMDGCVGMSMLADRSSGRCIATTAWQTEEAMRASAERVRPLRDGAEQAMGATTSDVDTWEMTVVHRDHATPAGAYARVTWLSGDPAMADRATDVYRMGVLPRVQELDGFCSASFMVNRETGRAVGTVTFESRAHVEASRDAATSIRANATSELGAAIDEVAELEVALAHLHVPEMA